MKKFTEMSVNELEAEYSAALEEYNKCKALGLKLDMSRGKPNAEQIDTVEGMLNILNKNEDCFSNGLDVRNYGIVDGIPEAKKLFADLMEVKPENVIVAGNSSLNLMYDTLAGYMLFGSNGSTPWCRLPKVKFLCPVPGYDRHFAVTEALGIEMINVKMTDNGPDVEEIRRLCENDDSVKGIWCNPKYSNPEGVVYSDETIKALASLKPAAKDFKIMWDNAYIVHFLAGGPAKIANIIEECEKAGNPDMVIEYVSTSKISFPGAGVAAMASSVNVINELKARMSVQTIGPNKINQLIHVRYFKDLNGVLEVMKKYADALKPRFELVLNMLEEGLGEKGIITWKKPEGGYFISVQVLNGTAKRVVELSKEAGVVLTGAGAAYPYKKDPDDSNIRLAPTFPPIEELKQAMQVFAVAVRLAAAEKLLNK